jgi:hypothetical protein
MELYETFAVAGALAAAVAALAWIAERRRLHRADLDRVGWVPWTGVFFAALLGAVMLFAVAIKLWAGR